MKLNGHLATVTWRWEIQIGRWTPSYIIFDL